MIKLLSTTQIPLALSVGESEWHALVRTGSALLGFKSMAQDFGRSLRPALKTDSSTAIGIGSRRGVGKIRHLSTQTLWLQNHVTEKTIKLLKEPGKENVADLGTKHVDHDTLKKMVSKLGFVAKDGKSKLSKAIVALIELLPHVVRTQGSINIVYRSS